MSLAHQMAANDRWYCKSCGEVRQAAKLPPLRVEPHWTGSSMLSPESDLRRKCPGGPIDREKDKAP